MKKKDLWTIIQINHTELFFTTNKTFVRKFNKKLLIHLIQGHSRSKLRKKFSILQRKELNAVHRDKKEKARGRKSRKFLGFRIKNHTILTPRLSGWT